MKTKHLAPPPLGKTMGHGFINTYKNLINTDNLQKTPLSSYKNNAFKASKVIPLL